MCDKYRLRTMRTMLRNLANKNIRHIFDEALITGKFTEHKRFFMKLQLIYYIFAIIMSISFNTNTIIYLRNTHKKFQT